MRRESYFLRPLLLSPAFPDFTLLSTAGAADPVEATVSPSATSQNENDVKNKKMEWTYSI